MEDIKRLNYFTSQFLVVEDFTDEQAYHMDMRRRHNRWLHTWGIADGGLQVTKSADKIISIGSGMAIDKEGQELVLLDAQSEDLTRFGLNADVYITAEYEEVQASLQKIGGVGRYTRTKERLLVKVDTTVPANDVIVLAKVKLDGGGNISNIDNTVRKIAGSAIDPTVDLAANSLSVTGNATVNGNVGIGTAGPVAKLTIQTPEDYSGNMLRVESRKEPNNYYLNLRADTSPSVVKWVFDQMNVGTNFPSVLAFDRGNVGIGTATPKAKLQVVGGAIMPENGNTDATGILFPSDPGGGTGDKAWMRYYARTGEDTTLEIGTSDGPQDHISLMPSGNVGIGTATPKRPLHIVPNRGVPNPIVIESAFASDADAKTLLKDLPANSLIVGGIWNNGLFFYWKDSKNNFFSAVLPGGSV